MVDEETDIGRLLSWLPVWAWSTPARRREAPELWARWNDFWFPEPALTLINAPVGTGLTLNVLDAVPTVEMHHNSLAAIRFFGLEDSSALREDLAAFGYRFVSGSDREGLLFAVPVSLLSEVPALELDGADWTDSGSLYDSFFVAVGAPEWHGRNFNALRDSIATGRVNKLEVPYTIEVRNSKGATDAACEFLAQFASFIEGLQAEGCPVAIHIHD